jgi:hypothetical protein
MKETSEEETIKEEEVFIKEKKEDDNKPLGSSPENPIKDIIDMKTS